MWEKFRPWVLHIFCHTAEPYADCLILGTFASLPSVVPSSELGPIITCWKNCPGIVRATFRKGLVINNMHRAHDLGIVITRHHDVLHRRDLVEIFFTGLPELSKRSRTSKNHTKKNNRDRQTDGPKKNHHNKSPQIAWCALSLAFTGLV